MKRNILYDKRVFKGAMGFSESSEGITPLRFDSNLLKVYQKRENHAIRSRCCAGIKLDIKTDSPFICFEFDILSFCRSWAYFDLVLDGIYSDSYSINDLKPGSYGFSFVIDNTHNNSKNDILAIRHIEVFFPHTAEVVFREITIGNNSIYEPAVQTSRSLFCLGDSITQGMDAYHPYLTFPAIIADRLSLDLYNHGVGGYFFDPATLDFQSMSSPGIVLIAYGTNDWNKYDNINDFSVVCDKYFEKVSHVFRESKGYVITPIWRYDILQEKNMGSFKALSQTIAEAADKYSGFTSIDGTTLIQNNEDFFRDKRIHPTDEGNIQMALNLIKIIDL